MPKSGRRCRRPKTSEDIRALEQLGYGATDIRRVDGHQAITIRLWSIPPARWFARGERASAGASPSTRTHPQ